jgi:hypothetical protein
MSTIGDLMGLGMPAALAARLGNTPATLAAAASTSQTGAALLTNHVTLITAVSAGANSTVFATAASLGTPWYITNSTASGASALVYCPVSGTMNQTSNGSTTLATGKTAIFIQNAQSSWVSVLTA